MDPFHKFDDLDRVLTDHAERLDNQRLWIDYFEAERKILMATLEDLQAKIPALDDAVHRVGEYVATLSQKVDEASAEHPAIQEMIGHVSGLTEALARMVPQEKPEQPEQPEVAEVASEAASAPEYPEVQ